MMKIINIGRKQPSFTAEHYNHFLTKEAQKFGIAIKYQLQISKKPFKPLHSLKSDIYAKSYAHEEAFWFHCTGFDILFCSLFF